LTRLPYRQTWDRDFLKYLKRLERKKPVVLTILDGWGYRPQIENNAIALARNGGLSFLHHNQSIQDQVAAVREVKNFKAGFVTSDTNIRPDDSLSELVEVMRRTGHSTAAVTEDGTGTGRLLGLVTSRDFHPQRHDLAGPVSGRMTPIADLPHAGADSTLSEANAQLWDQRLDCLPVLDRACVTLHCSRYAKHPGEDHLILIGRVDRTHLDEAELPAAYSRRNFHPLPPHLARATA